MVDFFLERLLPIDNYKLRFDEFVMNFLEQRSTEGIRNVCQFVVEFRPHQRTIRLCSIHKNLVILTSLFLSLLRKCSAT